MQKTENVYANRACVGLIRPGYAGVEHDLTAASDALARQCELADTMAAAGWRDVEWQNLSGGIVALHRGRA